MEFRDPEALLLLALLPLAFLAWWLLRTTPQSVRLPALTLALLPGGSVRSRFRFVVPLLYLAALALLIVALARPRSGEALSVVPAEGIDIVLSLDISSSMRENLGPERTRLEAVKNVITNFVEGLENDRVGLVVFQEESLALSPPTLDYRAITGLVEEAEPGLLPDGTAIGLGIADSVNLLRESRAKSRIVILLTDGRNNQFTVTPAAAAELARTLGIRVYSIGLTNPGANFSNLDTDLLAEIGDTTGGAFFAVSDEEQLAEVYEEIGRLEKSRVGGEEYTVFDEYGPRFALGAVALLALGVVLSQTVFRRAP